MPDYPDWVAKRLAAHTAVYKQHVRRFVGQADLFHLTSQPRRSGEGERWSAFQYSQPDGSEHLLFVFRLPGSPNKRAISMVALDPARLYTVEGFEGEYRAQFTGEQLLTTGLLFDRLVEENSALLRVS